MSVLKICTEKKHVISPYLYMQFMEPLGVADSSIDAAWDFAANEWYPEVIEKVRELSPTMVRFGGCFASYYHWKEGIGQLSERKTMLNYAWGGMYHNYVGTHEIIDFCRKVGAEPLLVANMESEGLDFWQKPQSNICRMGTAAEAAEWVDYCNNPDNIERVRNGAETPFNVKYWQIGNETSYKTLGYRNNTRHTGFSAADCLEVSQRFASAMREKDNDIKIIGWGDSRGSNDGANWCKVMSQAEGVDMIAFHHHFGSGLQDSPLTGTKYRDNVEYTWLHLMNAYKSLEEHISEMRADCGGKRLAMTEGHYALPGRNRNEVLSSWGAGVSYARCLNVIMRNSDILDIATMADFFGNVWQVNALMIPTPIRSGKPYLQPVGSVMSLFGKYQGEYAIDISYNCSIDAVASATGNRVFIHIANTDMKYPQEITLDLCGKSVKQIELHYIAEDPATEITPVNTNVFDVKHLTVTDGIINVPPAAVMVAEIVIEE